MMQAISRALLLAAFALGLCAGSAREEGLAAFREGHFSVALAKFEEAAKDPADKTAHAFLALTQAALNNCNAAIPGLTAVHQGAVLERLTGIAAARCYSSLGDDVQAFAVLHRLKQEFPNDADVLYTAAKLHIKAFNDETLAMFQRVPSSYRVHQLSAEIFEIDNRSGEAAAEYRKAIALNPQAPELHFRLGRAILLEGHDPQALAQAKSEFEAELALSPEDAACEFQLGQIAQAQTDDAGAKAHFQRAISMAPSFVEALIALAKVQSQDKQYGEAITLLERAIKLDPANERAHYVLLTVYRNGGQMEKARQEKQVLDNLHKAPAGEFSDFLKKLGEKPPSQQ